MLIVTGATGQLGRKIVENLLHHVAAERIGISVRDTTNAEAFTALGVRVRQGDYNDPESLRHAWDGAEHLLLVSSNAAASGGNPLPQHATAIDVARDIGVERIFYTSQVSSSPDAHFPPGRDHAATEAMLATSGMSWTALRHGFYAASAVMMNAKGLKAGRFAAPQDGKVAWTTHDDLAAVDAALLAGQEVIDGPTPPLTGAEALDLAELAERAGQIMGRPVERVLISEDVLQANARASGVPEGSIAVMLGYYRAARAGEFSTVDPTLSRILGRAPQTMSAVLQASLR
ncbi:NAD(P)H-binding protein [Roseobacter sp. TSBP12]|uniref:NmrA family NAD(P)-binding protein n=1 Tax=Roseobacter sp. TSBP12 TaxID=1236613 RepID=UPI00125FD523|nr:NAD(P)H-binding protein [Roseobacter sp. TSBP12]KAB6714569.1 NAD(P)-dependent oxidoreductase [Roseobacter sp. TSBP12]